MRVNEPIMLDQSCAATPHFDIADAAPTFPNRIYLHSGQTDRIDDSVGLSTLPTVWDNLATAGVSHKYYFQDLAAEVMDEIMRGMEAALPEPSWEEIDQWLNTTTSSRLFPVWYVHRTGCRLCASALRHPETP